jgi:predicted transcriptional regulator
MDLYGEVVKHKKFGIGTIVKSKSDYIEVLFHDTNEQKKFLYPEAIGEFLELQSKASSNDEQQGMKEMETGHEGEHEQKRIKNIKGIIKRENIIKKIIGIRTREEKDKQN